MGIVKEEARPVENIFKKITERIINLLDQGEVPWQKPWKSSSIPINLFTQKEYRGINVFLLNMAGYSSPYWLTMLQAEKLGGCIRPDEQGTEIVFWSMFRKQNESSDDVNTTSFMKSYTVYNIAQCEGIKDPWQGNLVFNPIEKCEHIIREMPNRPNIRYRGNSACYLPIEDKIRMPQKESFISEQEYYSTLFHEITHSTGHKSRLDRKSIEKITPFGTPNYSKEELIAEMGASFLCAITGIENKTINNSAAYIQSWIEKLQNDKRLISMAAAQATKAVDYIRGKSLD